MPCDPLVPVTCVDLPDPIGEAGDAVAGALGNEFAQAMADGAGWVLRTTVGWWVDVPAVDVVTSPATTIRSYVLWAAVAIATIGVMWQGVRLMLSRRADPLIGVGRGLFVFALLAAVGIVAPAAALRAGDAFATWVLDESTGGQLAVRLQTVASFSGVTASGAVIVLGLLMILSGIAQAVVMIFREGAVVVLSGAVVLAAAGSFSQATRPWLHRVVGWMAALIAYKPIAALVYATAFAMVGEGTDPRTVLVGLTMIVLAVVALPALMKSFTWTSGTVADHASSGTAVLGAGVSAVHAVASSAGSGGAAVQAGHIRQDLGPAAGGSLQPGATTAKAGAVAGVAPGVGVAASGSAALGASGGAVGAGAAAAGPVGLVVAGGAVAAQGAGAAAAAAKRHLAEPGEQR
jgi:hypothetical protein